MKITTKITLPDYLQLMNTLNSKTPKRIFEIIFGTVFTILCLNAFTRITTAASAISPILGVILGLYALFLLPYKRRLVWKEVYFSHQRLQEEIEWNFEDNKMILTGSSFQSEFDLNKLYKIVEEKEWFLLYENNTIANLLSKKSMTQETINIIREVFKNLNPNVIKKMKS